MMIPDKIKNKNKNSSPIKSFYTSSTFSSSTGLYIPNMKGESMIKNETVKNESIKEEINQNWSNDIKYEIKREIGFFENVKKEAEKVVEIEVEKEEVRDEEISRPLGPIGFMQLHAGILDLSSAYDFSKAEVRVNFITFSYCFSILFCFNFSYSFSFSFSFSFSYSFTLYCTLSSTS